MVRLTNVDSNPDTIGWGGGEVEGTFDAATSGPSLIKATFSLPSSGPYRFFGGSGAAVSIEPSGNERSYSIPLTLVRLGDQGVPRVDVTLTVVECDAGGNSIGRSKQGVFSLTPPVARPASFALAGSVSMGEALKQRRHELGMTQEAVAEFVGLHPSTVSRIERGLSCSDGTCSKINKIL